MDQDNILQRAKTISTGSIRMDALLGGGFPQGQITHIYGETDSGKSSIALSSIRDLPPGSIGTYVDAEFKFDPGYTQHMGINLESLVVVQTANAREILNLITSLGNTVHLLAIDSSTSIWDGEARMDEISYAISQTICNNFLPHGGTVLLISQTRLRPGVGMVPTGGAPSMFYPAMIVRVERGRVLSIAGTPCGRTSTLTLEKNRLGRLGTTDVDIHFARGFRKDVEILESAISLNIIQRDGTWYKYRDMVLGTDKRLVAERLSNMPLWNTVKESVMKFHNLI